MRVPAGGGGKGAPRLLLTERLVLVGLAGQTWGVKMTVYVENWQMDCCGDPFSAGSHVSWTLIQGRTAWIQTILGPDADLTIDAKEDHHGKLPAGTPATHGTTRGIYTISCQYAPSAGSTSLLEPVPGSGVLSRVVEAHRFGHHHYGGQGKFLGYIAQIITG